jgi:RNA polymerase sigma-70 factor (ECF subfamily)
MRGVDVEQGTLDRVESGFDWGRAFEAERRHLFGVAYRMTGSASLADDLVQDAWLRASASAEVPRSPRAYLTTIVTRLALDALTSARARRETYVGPGSPSPS